MVPRWSASSHDNLHSALVTSACYLLVQIYSIFDRQIARQRGVCYSMASVNLINRLGNSAFVWYLYFILKLLAPLMYILGINK